MKKDENKPIIDLISTGSEIVGSATGGIIGFFAAGPIGAAAAGAGGVIVAKGLSKLGIEIKQRLLGKREEVRIGATMFYSVSKIQENLKNGLAIRTDNFFQNDNTSRSDADEIFEGIMISSQKEYEEKKIKYLGNLLGNIAFHEDVNKSFANQLIKLSEELSYNQLCLLKIISSSGNLKTLKLRTVNYKMSQKLSRELITVLYDLIYLENRHLIINSEHHVMGLTDIIPSEFSVQGNGNALIILMELNEIPQQDIIKTIEILSN